MRILLSVLGRAARVGSRAMLTSSAAVAALGLPGAALAHAGASGHDHDALASLLLGFSHPFTGLDHLAAAVALGVWSALALKRPWLAPGVFALSLLLGAALAFAGMGVPLLEPMIAASVLVLGLLMSARTALAPAAASALAVGFALFHGAAHGQELVGALGPFALLGMAAGTALLLGAGLALGRALRQHTAWMPRVAGGAVAVFGAALLAPALAGTLG